MWSSEQSRFKKQHLRLLAHDTIPSSIEKINQRRYLVLYCSHSQPRAPHKQKHPGFSSTARAVETSQLGRRRRRIGGRRTAQTQVYRLAGDLVFLPRTGLGGWHLVDATQLKLSAKQEITALSHAQGRRSWWNALAAAIELALLEEALAWMGIFHF